MKKKKSTHKAVLKIMRQRIKLTKKGEMKNRPLARPWDDQPDDLKKTNDPLYRHDKAAV